MIVSTSCAGATGHNPQLSLKLLPILEILRQIMHDIICLKNTNNLALRIVLLLFFFG